MTIAGQMLNVSLLKTLEACQACISHLKYLFWWAHHYFWLIRKKVEKDISNNRVSFRLVRNLSSLFCPQMPEFRRIPDALRLRE